MSSLRDFRDTVRQEADRTPAPALSAILARKRSPGSPWAWAVATATVLALIAVPYYNQRQMQEQDRADALLMEKVNRALSRSVPQALEPLMGENQCEPKSC